MTFSRRKKNLNISDSTINYEVSRKDCGKLELGDMHNEMEVKHVR